MITTNDSYQLPPCPSPPIPPTLASATVRRIAPMSQEYLCAVEGTLSEWRGAADEEAYRGIRVPRQPGSAQGQIMIGDDFDGPLCGFDEYQ
ncbi:MAG: hypothetical protein JZU64_18365 [Rhodoferax sp.]|jgi:hypothetical protein|nr:hypothetical protein [Rhodoferax sp.]